MLRLLRHRNARVYLTGQVLSLFGDSCLWLAMGIWVKSLTHSNAAAGLTFFFYTAPSVLAPASGLLADRMRRRPLLIAVNLLTAGAVLLLLLVHSTGQVWLVYLVMTCYGLSYSVLGSAQSALFTVIVPAGLLPDANGALRTVQESLRLAGPLAGAGLFVAVGAHATVILDAVTFAAPVTSLLLLRVAEPAPQPRTRTLRAELTAGVHHVARTIQLRQVVIAGAIATTVLGFGETVTYAVAGNGLHRPTAFVGVLVAVQGVGAVAGGTTAAPLVRRIGEGQLIAAGLLTAAAGALLEAPPFLASVVAGCIIAGAAIPWLVVALISLAQRLTPVELQGRVYSAVDVLITIPQTISIALGAALITIAGYRTLLLAMTTVMALAGIYLLTRPEQRHASAKTSAVDPDAPAGQLTAAKQMPNDTRPIGGMQKITGS
jgi:MFS family permease